jgi:hypothetical protein
MMTYYVVIFKFIMTKFGNNDLQWTKKTNNPIKKYKAWEKWEKHKIKYKAWEKWEKHNMFILLLKSAMIFNELQVSTIALQLE